MSSRSTATLHKAPRSDAFVDQGPFRIRFNFPGRAVPGHDDHGYGPLATIAESFMDPDTLIRMHQHRNEEIISWVPRGVMRHDDRQGNKLVTDPEHLLVMSAGSGFWHEERTLADDPPLRMLQIFVRPHSLGLEPGIQHERLPKPAPNEPRHVFGPEGSDAPCYVRNNVHLYDINLFEGATVSLPAESGWDTYLYVFDGAVSAIDSSIEATESAVFVGNEPLSITAKSDSLVVVFSIDPDAPITRQGTIGR
ncbi:pirin family protein [Halalkalirubrum salinum]|uniref:pirin family protein n=1 Tax=Halalkalirubrum salinum TaxID=2563889 RepID=UPI0010FB6AB4|nr:pirin family protein [Halalkalirubrum salinum]